MQQFNNELIVYQNGKFIKSSDIKIDLKEQLLNNNLVAFEGIRAYKTHNSTRIFKAGAHFERLKKSCELVGLPFHWNIADLIKQTYKLLELNNIKDAYIKPIVYSKAQVGLENYQEEVSIIIQAWEWSSYIGDKQLNVTISSFQKPNSKTTIVEAKTNGSLNANIVSLQAKIKGFDEALQLDENNFIAGAPNANIFIEKNGKLFTPSLGNIFPGITRKTVFELCRMLDIEVIEKQITINELLNASGAFLCSTLTEITPIASIDETVYRQRWRDSIGATLQRAYKNLVLEKVNYEVII